MEQGKKILTFLRIVQYVITEPSNQRLKSCGQPSQQLEVEEDNYESDDDKIFEPIERICLPLMDPQPSTSSYLPPVYWVNLNNIVKKYP